MKTQPHASESSSSLVASSIAGVVSRLIMHPADTIKTRILNSRKQDPHAYRGTLDAIRRTASHEGVLGFYRGLLPSIILAAPAQAAYFTTYEKAKSFYSHAFSSDSSSFLVHFISGFTAETVSCIFWVPHDLIKERLQAEDEGNVRGQLRRVWSVLRSDGLISAYKGYGVTLGSFGFMSAFYFVFYEHFKERFRDMRRGGTLGGGWNEEEDTLPVFPDILVSSSCAISAASTLTQPLELVKTRYQIQRSKSVDGAYKGTLDAFGKIIREEGVTQLWKGTTARLYYTVPNAVLVMLLFEHFKANPIL